MLNTPSDGPVEVKHPATIIEDRPRMAIASDDVNFLQAITVPLLIDVRLAVVIVLNCVELSDISLDSDISEKTRALPLAS